MRSLPRPAWERVIPLPDPDFTVPVRSMDGYDLLTTPSRWYVFPVSEDGVETLIKGTLIEVERDVRGKWSRQ